jgi:CBS domain-containing protein
MALMTEKRLRHLPVMDGERLVGIISIVSPRQRPPCG